MPYFWDMTPDTLPRPELNPLANPALERNLSRWAEVYFGNPPGKREEAVKKLLQEIKNETSEILLAEQARRESSDRAAKAGTSSEIRSGEIRFTEIPDIRCSICQHQNPASQRFCGQCGAAVGLSHSGSEIRSSLTSNRTSSAAPPAAGEVQWLRERSLNHLYETEAPAWRGWKYVLGGVVVALAGVAYMQWNFNHPATVVSPVAGSAARVTTPASARPADQPSSAATQPSEPDRPATSSSIPQASVPKPVEVQPAVVTPRAQVVHNRGTETTGIQSAVQKSSLLSAPMPTGVEGGSGGSGDLRLAQRYLAGSMGVRDPAQGARLLWKAVGKQNATAAILLSGLYARGDGVPKSCDQARLLLVAAAKQGSRQAAEQLRDLERRGCQ